MVDSILLGKHFFLIRAFKMHYNLAGIVYNLNTLSVANIHARIDNYANELNSSGAIKRNFERWDILGEQVVFNSFVGETYEDEIEYIKSWIEARIEWMDSQINN